MIWLDENITEDQRLFLLKWKISFKQIGVELPARKGTDDHQIVSFLHQAKGVLFLSRDSDFWDVKLCHSNYCLVYLEVDRKETAIFIRKFLKHELFNTNRKRLGKVVKVNQTLVSFYEAKGNDLKVIKWE